MAEPAPDTPDALSRRLAAMGPGLYQMAVRILNNEGKAEDVVQDAFVQALGRMRTDVTEPEQRVWLYRVASNKAKDHLRAAMEALDRKYRVPIALCYEQGLTKRDAAAVLEIPEGALSDHVRAGLSRLRKALERAGFPAATAAITAGLTQTARRAGGPRAGCSGSYLVLQRYVLHTELTRLRLAASARQAPTAELARRPCGGERLRGLGGEPTTAATAVVGRSGRPRFGSRRRAAERERQTRRREALRRLRRARLFVCGPCDVRTLRHGGRPPKRLQRAASARCQLSVTDPPHGNSVIRLSVNSFSPRASGWLIVFTSSVE
jgi:RNA polymerase sigma-70 factor (ECF subfamily)